MRLLSRGLFTFILLGGLAFGSYAFGKYVLSSRLFGVKGANLKKNFGETVSDAKPANSSRSASNRDAASASVEILPAGGADTKGSSPSPSVSSSAIDRSNRGGDDGALSGTADATSGATYPDSTSGSTPDSTVSPSTRRRRRSSAESRDVESTPEVRPRKKRKKRKKIRQNDTGTREEPVRATYPDDNAGNNSNADAGNSDGGVVIRESSPSDGVSTDQAPAPRVETRIEPRRATVPGTSDDNSDLQPRRRRRRIRERVEATAPRERIRSRERVREAPARRIEESPVPQPESGDDSPVPIPE